MTQKGSVNGGESKRSSRFSTYVQNEALVLATIRMYVRTES